MKQPQGFFQSTTHRSASVSLVTPVVCMGQGGEASRIRRMAENRGRTVPETSKRGFRGDSLAVYSQGASARNLGIVLIWLSNLAVPPFLDIALRQQAATSDKKLDTFGDKIVSSITFRQVAAHCVCDFDNHKCNFPPRCFSNGENNFINLEVAQRTH